MTILRTHTRVVNIKRIVSQKVQLSLVTGTKANARSLGHINTGLTQYTPSQGHGQTAVILYCLHLFTQYIPLDPTRRYLPRMNSFM